MYHFLCNNPSMLDINLIQSNPDWVTQQLAKRDCNVDLMTLLKLNDQRKKLITKNEKYKSIEMTKNDFYRFFSDKQPMDDVVKKIIEALDYYANYFTLSSDINESNICQ
jgi:seryl-tRNA synthetase